MSADRYAFDTNIYFYSVDTSAGQKYFLAREMMRMVHLDRSVMPIQTLGELANSILNRGPALFSAATEMIRDL